MAYMCVGTTSAKGGRPFVPGSLVTLGRALVGVCLPLPLHRYLQNCGSFSRLYLGHGSCENHAALQPTYCPVSFHCSSSSPDFRHPSLRPYHEQLLSPLLMSASVLCLHHCYAAAVMKMSNPLSAMIQCYLGSRSWPALLHRHDLVSCSWLETEGLADLKEPGSVGEKNKK